MAHYSPTLPYELDAPAGTAHLDDDPFSDDNLDKPHDFQALVRDAGDVVWLNAYNVAAVAGYEEVTKVFADWKSYTSTRGVGLADYKRHGRFRIPSIILEVDPPVHTRNRTVMTRALSPSVMKTLREDFNRQAAIMVDGLIEKGRIDGVSEIAEAFPLRVFPDALGMKREGRENLLPYGDMVFNSFGPSNHLFKAAEPRAQYAFPWVREQSQRKNLSRDGFASIIFEAVDSGELPEEDAELLVKSLLTAGLDTTVSSLGAALLSLVQNQSEWEKLKNDPSLSRGAFEEAIRFECPVQTFFRTTSTEVELSGVKLEEGTKIMLCLAGANRDPRKWENPDAYDITRKTIGHVGYGFGLHACVGQMLARLEGEAVLGALAQKVETLELAGTPVRRLNNTLRGLESLPLEIRGK
ncbi:cytochrome P450 (plasmid) [Agrobacterium tumefaciens]|uniref:Cytochrome P450 n=2 Tax=Agrobacterium tumefaciens TaxID=358 RepID=A0AAJ4TDH5_AGRTU|nr:cytochrome P450 [Agrobacterium tumefaciens]